MRYIAQIVDSGPLSFRNGRETTSGTTLDYIPGSVLLGGLASAHAHLRGDETEFNRFFGARGTSFGNLYPAAFSRDELNDERDMVVPLPTTAQSCKRFKGFTFDEDDPVDTPHHGVYDSLIQQALFVLSGQTAIHILNRLANCPTCGAPLDRFDGFYRRSADRAEVMGSPKLDQGLRTRTGINRATGTVQQGILYSREVLRAGSQFWGTVTVADEANEDFDDFIAEVNRQRMLRLGNNRTRGFGRVTMTLQPPEAGTGDDTTAIRGRIEAFNDKLRQEADQAQVSIPADAVYLPLTLTADAIVPDRLLRYQTTLPAAYLEGRGIAGTKLIYQNSRSYTVMGWNSLLGMPKADEVAITKGAVFLFELPTAPDNDLLTALLTLQQEGLGVRRREGFGRLVVASPFHSEVNGQ